MPFVVVDEKLPAEAKEKLNKLGFTVLPLPSFGKLKGSLSSHPDMLFQCLEGKLFCPRSYLDDPEAKPFWEQSPEPESSNWSQAWSPWDRTTRPIFCSTC